MPYQESEWSSYAGIDHIPQSYVKSKTLANLHAAIAKTDIRQVDHQEPEVA